MWRSASSKRSFLTTPAANAGFSPISCLNWASVANMIGIFRVSTASVNANARWCKPRIIMTSSSTSPSSSFCASTWTLSSFLRLTLAASLPRTIWLIRSRRTREAANFRTLSFAPSIWLYSSSNCSSLPLSVSRSMSRSNVTSGSNFSRTFASRSLSKPGVFNNSSRVSKLTSLLLSSKSRSVSSRRSDSKRLSATNLLSSSKTSRLCARKSWSWPGAVIFSMCCKIFLLLPPESLLLQVSREEVFRENRDDRLPTVPGRLSLRPLGSCA
mmetsp:Transcript_30184/g.86977  ORF Transcript_30184/g.86977 Transcript_30184/m.86977 type:complete len:270 (-) Transcript_30184:136-945(-)